MILINDLQIKSKPRLLFMANSLQNKGRSHKSYTIEIVNNKHNNSLLSNLFGTENFRPIRFETKYEVGGFEMVGFLLVSSVDKHMARAIFVSGNGSLWEQLNDIRLIKYSDALSKYNHVLTKSYVSSSEAFDKAIVYDFTDRGRFAQDQSEEFDGDTAIDITERYPAINVLDLITTIINSQGFWVDSIPLKASLNYQDWMLMFTQDNDILNTNDWKEDAMFKVRPVVSVGPVEPVRRYTFTTDGSTFSIAQQLDFKQTDYINTNYYSQSTNKFTAQVAGTYRLILPYSLVLSAQYETTSNVISLRIKKSSGGYIYAGKVIEPVWQTVAGAQVGYVSGYVDTRYVHILEGEQFEVEFTWEGNTTVSVTEIWVDTVVTFDDNTAWNDDNKRIDTMFYNEASRYYGINSNVEIANLLPDMTALDFISKVFEYLNIYAFYQEETKTLELHHGRTDQQSIAEIELFDVKEDLTEKQNYWFRYSTDKADPPKDQFFDQGGLAETEIKLDFSRTLLARCYRLLKAQVINIPVLWSGSDKSPLAWGDRNDPPTRKTKANLRIMVMDDPAAICDHLYTFNTLSGSVSAQTHSYPKTAPSFKEILPQNYYQYEMMLQGATITGKAHILETWNLYDQSWFKKPLHVKGKGVFWLQEAKQIEGDIYELVLIK